MHDPEPVCCLKPKTKACSSKIFGKLSVGVKTDKPTSARSLAQALAEEPELKKLKRKKLKQKEPGLMKQSWG